MEKMNFQEIFGIMVDKKASHFHMVPGSPIMMRQSGTLSPMDSNILSPQDTRNFLESLMSDAQKKEFDEKPTQAGGRPAFILSDETTQMQKKLAIALGKLSTVKMTRSKRETKILIKLKGSPEETESTLAKILSLAN